MTVQIKKWLGCSALAATIAASPVACAQEADPTAAAGTDETAGNPGGEIVVTAQKRSERLSNVGLTITALSGDQLARQGVLNTADLVKVTPGFQFAEGTYGAPVYTLRGIGFYETSLAASPSVSVYVDEVPLPYPNQTRNAALDLERVEILKGPQGTLFGVNATGGAINYIAAKPTDSLRYGGDFTFGRFNQIVANAFVSGPLSDKISARIAVRTEQGDPWQHSYSRRDALGAIDRTSGRMLVELRPSDAVRFQMMVNAWYDRSDTQAGQLIGLAPQAPAAVDLVPGLADYPNAPANARAADWNPGTAFRRDDRFYQLSVRGEVDLADELTLVSISSYQKYRGNAFSDTDGTTLSSTEASQRGFLKTFTQELRLQGGGAGGLSWIIGGNYQHDSTFDELGFVNPESTLAYSIPGFFISDSTVRTRQKVKVLAAFGNIELPVSDAIILQGGLRYSDTRRLFAGCLYDTGNGNLAAVGNLLTFLGTGSFGNAQPGGCVTIGADFQSAVYQARLDENNLSWRVGAKWKVSPATLLYANISKGYKAGSFPTLGATVFTQLRPVVQESVLAYEAGLKSGFLDRTVTLNAAAFLYDYKNKQTRGRQIDPILGALEALVNVPRSRVAGAEADLTWQPDRAIRLNLGAIYTHSEIRKDFQNFTPVGTPGNFDGEPLPLTPRWQVNASADIDQPLSSTLKAFGGATLAYQGRSNSGLGQLELFTLKERAVLDLRAGIATEDDRWRFSIWGKNVTNKYYWTNALHQIDTIVRYAAMPATYGLTMAYRY